MNAPNADSGAQDEQTAPRKRRRRESGERIEGDEVLRLVPRHELQSLFGRNHRAVESEDQRREERDLCQAKEQGDWSTAYPKAEIIAKGSVAPGNPLRGRRRVAGGDSAGIILHIKAMPKPHRPASRPLSRRKVLKSLVLGAATAAGLTARASRGGESGQRLDIHDPAAVALGYVENASQVDTKKFPQFVAGSNCDNCLQCRASPAITTGRAACFRQAGVGERCHLYSLHQWYLDNF